MGIKNKLKNNDGTDIVSNFKTSYFQLLNFHIFNKLKNYNNLLSNCINVCDIFILSMESMECRLLEVWYSLVSNRRGGVGIVGGVGKNL